MTLKTVAGMCVLRERIEHHNALDAVRSIAAQVDRLHVVTDAPELVAGLEREYLVEVSTVPRPRDGDKFLYPPLGAFSTDDRTVVFTCDDDLVYPADYVETMLRYLRPGMVVSAHGAALQGHVESYRGVLRTSAVVGRALGEVLEPRFANVLGTGVLAAHLGTIKGFRPWLHEVSAADLHLALWMQARQIPGLVVPHPADWFTYLNPTKTLWSSGTGASTGAKARRDYEDSLVQRVEWKLFYPPLGGEKADT